MPQKYVDFKKCEKIDPSFKGAYGLYDERTNTIYVHSGLDKPIPGKRETLLHEQAHRKVFKGGVKKYFDHVQEEAFCDLWAIVNYPRTKLHGLELQVYERVLGDLKWTDKKSKEKIIRNMLKEIGVKRTYALVQALI